VRLEKVSNTDGLLIEDILGTQARIRKHRHRTTVELRGR
jgi:hypothetical protein